LECKRKEVIMEFNGFSIGVSISAAIIVVVIIIGVFKRPLKDLIDRLRPEKYVDKYGGTLYFANNQIGSDFKYSKELITRDPPLSEEKIYKSAEAIIKKELSEKKNLSDKQKIMEILIPRLVNLQVFYILETVNSYLFGSQIILINHLNSKNRANIDELKSFYDKSAELYPSVYKDYPFESYIGFLIRWGLILQKGKYYRITGLGKLLIKRLKDTGRTAIRPL